MKLTIFDEAGSRSIPEGGSSLRKRRRYVIRNDITSTNIKFSKLKSDDDNLSGIKQIIVVLTFI